MFLLIFDTGTQFINHATQKTSDVGHGLQPGTINIQPIRATHPTTDDPVIFVDTPGFDNPDRSDMEILTMITGWLKQTRV